MITLPGNKKYSMVTLAIGGLFFIFWCVLFTGGLLRYPGSALSYTLFSLAFLALLASGLVRQKAGYGYLFLAAMLWLGFWLKVTIHLIFPYPFTEFIGRFSGNPDAWDEVLLIATIAATGVLVAGFSVLKVTRFIFKRQQKNQKYTIPVWYSAHRAKAWIALLISIALVATLNAFFGFQQSGLVPRTILGWHLNGVIYYFLSIVFSICASTLLWWDILMGRNVVGVVYVILFEGLASSISLLSRGTLVFHVLPQMLALYKFKVRLVGYAWHRALLLLFVFFVSSVMTYSIVNSLRNHYYSDVPLELSVESTLFQGDGSSKREGVRFLRFVVDRWLGVEGVMAVASYPEKNAAQFWRGLSERSVNGKVTMYQEICLSHYKDMDAGRFRFANLPGITGFLYYSGSLVAIFLGLMFFTIAIVICEGIVFVATGNPLVCAFVGGGLANMVCQFGVAPSNLLPMFVALTGSIAIVWLVQSGRLARLRQTMECAMNRAL